MFTFKKKPEDEYCKYDTTTIKFTTHKIVRDEVIGDFCDFMRGCGFIMKDVEDFIFDEAERSLEISDLEMELSSSEQDVVALETKIEELESIIQELMSDDKV